ncbi:MAG: Ig-like domain-containing protein [Tyzzerella sp.]|nr:Ig-like domain-containing protein [Tyzzerella sp.]
MLIATFIPSPYTNAAGEFTITGNSVNVKAGKEVSVNVSLVNNPGISAINLYYTYDTNYLTLKNVENKVSKFTMTNDVTTVWDAASNYTEDGILATLTFEVAKAAPSGDYTVGINFLSASNDSFQSVTAQTTAATITVEALPVATTGVTLNKNSVSLVTGDMETLIATVTPDNATNKAVSWKSSDTTVATVDSNGKVTAMKKGTATITVTTEDGSFTDTCEVSVACSHANTTVHPAVESTCLIQGNNTYTTCNDCGVIVSGSDAKLPFDSHKGGTATCKDKAVCIVCNKAYGEYAGHQLTNHPHNESNHSKAGNIEYWTCDICNKFFNDAAGKNEIEQKDTVIDKEPHSYNTEWSYNGTQHWKECACGEQTELANHQFDNDCDTTCNAGCGYTRSITHQWMSAYSTGDNKHWYECEICGEKKDEGNHSGGTASCKEKALCEVCNKSYGELKAHVLVEKVDNRYLKAEANCVAKAVYYKSCSVCGTASTETFKTGELDSSFPLLYMF